MHVLHPQIKSRPLPCLFACITISDVGIRAHLELLELLLLLGPAKAGEPVQVELGQDRTSGNGESQMRNLVKQLSHKNRGIEWGIMKQNGAYNQQCDIWMYHTEEKEREIR